MSDHRDPVTAAEWVEYLRECDDEELQQFAEAWRNSPIQFEAKWIAKGEPAADVQALCDLLSRASAPSRPKSVFLMQWARDAIVAPTEPCGDQEVDEPPGEMMPQFHSGIARLDHITGGGCYGMTVIAAAPKCGKSMLALGIALEAARAEWRVLYLNAELTRSEMANRIGRYCENRIPPETMDCMSIHPVDGGIDIQHVIGKLEERLDMDDQKVLIVVDSINRVAAMSQQDGSDRSHWNELNRWQEWFRRAAKISEGQLASVVVSELNAGGHIKGRQLEFAADLCVTIQPVDGQPGIFMIAVPYARSSAGGEIGKFKLEWQSGRFIHVGDE